MKLSKIISLSLVFVLGLSLLSKGQEKISDPKGYFDQFKAPATIYKKNGTPFEANLIYNDGYSLYYKTESIQTVQIISLSDVTKIRYSDGSEEMIFGSTTSTTYANRPNVVIPSTTTSTSTTESQSQTQAQLKSESKTQSETISSSSSPVTSNTVSTSNSETKSQPVTTNTSVENKNEPFIAAKRVITSDLWLSFGDRVVIEEIVYNGFSFTYGIRTDYGRSDGWLAKNSDLRATFSLAVGEYAHSSDFYFGIEETVYKVAGLGGTFGIDFYLYQSDRVKIWSGSEIGYFFYSEYWGDVEFGDYSDLAVTYGLYGGAQYRFSPNGLGLMVEVGPSSYHNIAFGLSLPIVSRSK